MKKWKFFTGLTFAVTIFLAGSAALSGDDEDEDKKLASNDASIRDYAARLVRQGREIFRFDTFGSESFWGGGLRLHETIAGSANGGIGPGLSPRGALSAGLKVDAAALPADIVNAV